MITEASIARWFERHEEELRRFFMVLLAPVFKRLGMDATFEESEHPRDENGRFASTGKGGKSKSKTLILPKQEYASVMSAINTVFHAKYKGKKSCGLLHGDYYYRFRNKGFSKYEIFAKIQIEGNEKLILKWEEGK